MKCIYYETGRGFKRYMLEIIQLKVSTVYLYNEQSHPMNM